MTGVPLPFAPEWVALCIAALLAVYWVWGWVGRLVSRLRPGGRYYVERVTDGDGVVARLPWGVERCRIRGMDAPELQTVGLAKWLHLPAWRARRAKRLLHRFCGRRYVRITWRETGLGVQRDRYGRVLVDVHRGRRSAVTYMTFRLAAVRWESSRRSPLKRWTWWRLLIGR